jgi:hypothetical protein
MFSPASGQEIPCLVSAVAGKVSGGRMKFVLMDKAVIGGT